MIPLLNQASAPAKSTASDPPAAWPESEQKLAYRHMRVTYKTHSRAVRLLVLQECLKDTPPGAGLERLIACIDSKLALH